MNTWNKACFCQRFNTRVFKAVLRELKCLLQLFSKKKKNHSCAILISKIEGEGGVKKLEKDKNVDKPIVVVSH